MSVRVLTLTSVSSWVSTSAELGPPQLDQSSPLPVMLQVEMRVLLDLTTLLWASQVTTEDEGMCGDLWVLLCSGVSGFLIHSPFSPWHLSILVPDSILGCHSQLLPLDQDPHLPGTTNLEVSVRQGHPQLFQICKSGQPGQDSIGPHCSGWVLPSFQILPLKSIRGSHSSLY